MPKPSGLHKRGQTWTIDKVIRGSRLRESCGTDNYDEALDYFNSRVKRFKAELAGEVRPRILFSEAAAKYLKENQHKRSIGDAIYHLKMVMPYIGHLPLERVHRGPLEPFIEKRHKEGVKGKTINLSLEMVSRVLNRCAKYWRFSSGLSFLETAPIIKYESTEDAAEAYPLDWDEQERLTKELPALLERMSLFKVNTGCREQEVCQLEWAWECDSTDPDLKGRIFIIPGAARKKTSEKMEDKYVVLNDTAKSVVDSMRGKHHRYVFVSERRTSRDKVVKYRPVARMNTTGWRNAWKKAGLPLTEKYVKGVHNLRHTFATRLRMLGVSEETRAQLLGHSHKSMTTHYSEAGLMELLDAVNLLTISRKSPALALVKLRDIATG